MSRTQEEYYLKILQKLEDNSTNLHLKVNYLFTLSEWEDKRALAPILEALKDKEDMVRELAVSRFKFRKDIEALPILEEIEKTDTNSNIRENAKLAIAHLKEQNKVN